VNLFIISWQLAQERTPAILTELLRLQQEVYPLLDADTLWHQSAGDEAFVASIHTATAAARPRSYVSQEPNHITFYEGVPVDRTGTFNALRADELSAHWDHLPTSLEGTFVIVRMTHSPPQIEVLTDPMGTVEVFYLNQGNTWLISNSARLLERIGKITTLDPLGVSLFVTIGWVGSDRTLRQDIRVMPAGMCHSLSSHFGKVSCPLTAGHDSRLLASVLIHARIPAQYYTLASYSSTDILVATQIAQAFALEHHICDHPVRDLAISCDSPLVRGNTL
jgi:asparagine synthase (glutamine-hydrolysing)